MEGREEERCGISFFCDLQVNARQTQTELTLQIILDVFENMMGVISEID